MREWSGNASFMEVYSMVLYKDACVVLPTFDHALVYWPIYRTMFRDMHDVDMVGTTKTAIVSKRTHTALRLWVPYTRDPTMPMDFHGDMFRERCDFVSPYYTTKELKRIAPS